MNEALRDRLVGTDDVPIFEWPEWHNQAACRDEDIALFFPEQGGRDATATAKLMCAGCPVRRQCDEQGQREQYGIWAGVNRSRQARQNRQRAQRRQRGAA